MLHLPVYLNRITNTLPPMTKLIVITIECLRAFTLNIVLVCKIWLEKLERKLLKRFYFLDLQCTISKFLVCIIYTGCETNLQTLLMANFYQDLWLKFQVQCSLTTELKVQSSINRFSLTYDNVRLVNNLYSTSPNLWFYEYLPFKMLNFKQHSRMVVMYRYVVK